MCQLRPAMPGIEGELIIRLSPRLRVIAREARFLGKGVRVNWFRGGQTAAPWAVPRSSRPRRGERWSGPPQESRLPSATTSQVVWEGVRAAVGRAPVF